MIIIHFLLVIFLFILFSLTYLLFISIYLFIYFDRFLIYFLLIYSFNDLTSRISCFIFARKLTVGV